MALDIRKPLKKFLPHLIQAQSENLNEADTRARIVKCFEDVLGYYAMTEITREKQIKDKYVDFAVRIDGVVRLLVEVKAAALTLRDRHIEQAERYAAEGNVRWVLLTNGVAWNLYHLSFEEGIEYERAFELDLTKDGPEQGATLLAMLHRQAIRSGELEAFWHRRNALSPESIAKALFTEDALRFIRREIRKREGLSIDQEDLAAAIHEMLCPEARERIGPVRIRRRKTARATRPSAGATGATADEEASKAPSGGDDVASVDEMPGTLETNVP
jgi:predicted type IV restriction endonuclease